MVFCLDKLSARKFVYVPRIIPDNAFPLPMACKSKYILFGFVSQKHIRKHFQGNRANGQRDNRVIFDDEIIITTHLS